MQRFLTYGNPFTPFSRQHLAVVTLTAALSILLALGGRYLWAPNQNLLLNRLLTLLIASAVIGWTLIRWQQNLFHLKTDLPFDICNLMAITLPFVMWTPSPPIHEILYFTILAGTLQAILTPDIPEGFPHYSFLKYWIVHCGLVVYIIFITAAFSLYPTWNSIWRAFIFLQFYLLFALAINYLLGSNYLYVMRKPPRASLLDYMGPWPWYILAAEFIALILFALVYLPIWILAT